jgi:KDO2-lipid IV(A) lauroyltransferase
MHPLRAPKNDVRLGERWTTRQRAKNDALYVLACVALFAASALPLPALRMLGRALGSVLYVLCAAARRTALDNVGRVFPELDARGRHGFVRRCFSTVGASVGETVALLRPRSRPPPLPVSPPALELVARARREGRPVLFVSAHLGAWEHVAASLVAAGIPLVALARESYDPRFSRLYEKLRSTHGVRVVWRASGGAATRIVRALREGSVLGVPMDLDSRVPSCSAPFLGHPARTAIGPARIALRTGADVLVGSIAPGERQPSAASGPVITATKIATHDLPRGSSGVHELTARINRELSHRILALPHAWVWMHPRWAAGTGV